MITALMLERSQGLASADHTIISAHILRNSVPLAAPLLARLRLVHRLRLIVAHAMHCRSATIKRNRPV